MELSGDVAVEGGERREGRRAEEDGSGVWGVGGHSWGRPRLSVNRFLWGVSGRFNTDPSQAGVP